MRKKALPPFVRECPECKKELTHTTIKHRNRARKDKKVCAACRMKEVNNRPDVRLQRSMLARKRVGKLNSFYGKKHSEKTREKLRAVDRGYTQTDEFRKNSARVGAKNGMYGRSFYDVWKEKFGEQEADKKFSEWLKVQSENSSGENNPMYGKPAPKGSGGGWGGWYKGWYFRSLRELSYVIRVLEKNNHEWQSAESKEFSIPYVSYDGTPRTYRPDFLVDGRTLVEVKPKQLMETPSNVLKKKAAIVFCKNNGFEFKMVDVKLLHTEHIIHLFEEGIIGFNKKYQERIELLCEKAKNKKLR